jgi:hypothetical protein
MKQHLQTIAARAAGWLPDMLMAAGASVVAYGAWLVYVPAGFLVGGALLLTAGVLAARKAG